MGGKAAQEKRKKRIEQQYLLGKYAECPILDKRTIKKFEAMGFQDEDINRALEITDAIMKGAKKGDSRMVEIYLRIMGEGVFDPPAKENNLLDALVSGTKEAFAADDIPEIQQTAESDNDVVEPPTV